MKGSRPLTREEFNIVMQSFDGKYAERNRCVTFTESYLFSKTRRDKKTKGYRQRQRDGADDTSQ